jgi:hypothetical protein
MSANGFRGNNTGAASNVLDLTPGQAGAVLCSPVTQTVTTGTNATYTTPTCNSVTAKYIEIFLKGAGGGSPGSGTTPGAAGNGGDTCLKASGTACTTPLYAAGGGTAGSASAGTSAAGGAVSGSATCDVRAMGGRPGGGGTNQLNSYGGIGGGGSAPGFGGASPPAVPVNSGYGAGGPGTSSTANAGGGGGEGAECVVRIFSPLSSYAYTVGAAGTAGTAGTGGIAGIIGGNGRIEFVAYFQ